MVPAFSISNLTASMPILIVSCLALIVMIADLFVPRENKKILAYLSIAGLIAAGYSSISLWGLKLTAFSGSIISDNFTLFFNILFIISAVLTILLSLDFLSREESHLGEYYILMLFATSGMMIMAASLDLISFFLGLEVMSIPLYVLASFIRTDNRGNEAALKYFLLGAFSTGFLLYGIAFVFGATATTKIPAIASFIAEKQLASSPLVISGMSFILIGFLFKIASVPFHMWTPDVYDGAPTPITAFMSTAVKAAAFAAFVRVFYISFSSLNIEWSYILNGIAIITMTVGNVVAIAQKNIKRMLAYSSIAHAGYILVGMIAGGNGGGASVLFYLAVYTFMNLGAFAVIIALSKKGEESFAIEDYKGIGFKYPLLAAAMAVFMLSLAGIPPTAGFIGKFYIFSSAINAGYIILAIIGVLNSVVSVYYYLRIVVFMYMEPAEKEYPLLFAQPALVLVLLISIIAIFQMGLIPSNVFAYAKASIASIF